jgi:hypothetical protein
MKDQNGLSWARKAMIRCGLSLGLDGTWSVAKLSPELQEIIKKYPADFNGVEPSSESDTASIRSIALSSEMLDDDSNDDNNEM